MRVLSIAGYIGAVLGAIALWHTHALIAPAGPAQLVQIGAVGLMLWARLTFGRRSFHAAANPTEGGLVTTGPYHYIRHPIYAAMLYFVWAGALTHIRVTSVLLALAVTVGFSVRMAAEEQLITERYPEYQAYAARTRRIVPWLL